MPFAGLHQLLLPLRTEIGELPAPQRDALGAAFGLTDAAVPDPFLIALAALNLLGEAAARSPVLLLVEDAHWLDRSSADVLAFVARRLDSEPIVMLAAIRDGFPSPLRRGGAAGVAARSARRRRRGRAAGRPQPRPGAGGARTVAAGGGGKPPGPGRAADRRARTARRGPLLPGWLPLTTRLEQAFTARMSGLPADHPDAAAGRRAQRQHLAFRDSRRHRRCSPVHRSRQTTDARGHRTADRRGRGRDCLFRHPLMRSAIHQGASHLPAARGARRAWPTSSPDRPDRRLWHRAASSPRPDEAIAAELEATAEARDAGAHRCRPSRRWNTRPGSATIPPAGANGCCGPPSTRPSWDGATSSCGCWAKPSRCTVGPAAGPDGVDPRRPSTTASATTARQRRRWPSSPRRWRRTGTSISR